jgi:hypothetical protein
VTAAFYREIETAARTQVLSNQNHWGLALYQFAPIGLQFESLRARCHVRKGMARIWNLRKRAVGTVSAMSRPTEVP